MNNKYQINPLLPKVFSSKKRVEIRKRERELLENYKEELSNTHYVKRLTKKEKQIIRIKELEILNNKKI